MHGEVSPPQEGKSALTRLKPFIDCLRQSGAAALVLSAACARCATVLQLHACKGDAMGVVADGLGVVGLAGLGCRFCGRSFNSVSGFTDSIYIYTYMYTYALHTFCLLLNKRISLSPLCSHRVFECSWLVRFAFVRGQVVLDLR